MVIADMDKCTKSPTGEHVRNYTPRPDNCRLGMCRYCDQQRVFEGAMSTLGHVAKTLSHTAAIMNSSPVSPETLEKAMQIAEKSLKKGACPQKGKRLTDGEKDRLRRLLSSGAAPACVAMEMGVSLTTVYSYQPTSPKPKKAATPATAPVPPAAPEVKRNGHKHQQRYNNKQGNIMSQMARLSRGEIKAKSARPVLTRYKELVEEKLKVKQSEVKELKQKLGAAEDALNALDIIEQGEKDIVEKVLAVVR
jgi:hypothetical protein